MRLNWQELFSDQVRRKSNSLESSRSRSHQHSQCLLNKFHHYLLLPAYPASIIVQCFSSSQSTSRRNISGQRARNSSETERIATPVDPELREKRWAIIPLSPPLLEHAANVCVFLSLESHHSTNPPCPKNRLHLDSQRRHHLRPLPDARLLYNHVHLSLLRPVSLQNLMVLASVQHLRLPSPHLQHQHRSLSSKLPNNQGLPPGMLVNLPLMRILVGRDCSTIICRSCGN